MCVMTFVPSINKFVPLLILISIWLPDELVAYNSWIPFTFCVTSEFLPICVAPSDVVLITVLPEPSLISMVLVPEDIIMLPEPSFNVSVFVSVATVLTFFRTGYALVRSPVSLFVKVLLM